MLKRCLRKDPKQRLRDIGDARISLDEVLSGGPQDAAQDAPSSFVVGRRRVVCSHGLRHSLLRGSRWRESRPGF